MPRGRPWNGPPPTKADCAVSWTQAPPQPRNTTLRSKAPERPRHDWRRLKPTPWPPQPTRLQDNRRGYAELRAVSPGVVTAIFAEPGQVVQAGTPVLRVAEAGPREAVIDIPEQRLAHVQRTAVGTLYGGGQFAVELRELAAAADPVTRTYRARYRIVGASPPLGSTVTLAFPNEGGEGQSTVPIGAVTERGEGFGLWIIGSDNKVAWRSVALSAMDGERAAVTGVRAGERVVALGAHLLQPGQLVRVADGPARLIASR